MTTRYFPIEEYEERWRRVEEAMRAQALDVAVVWSRSAGTYDRCADLLYLANYYGNQPGQGRRGPAGFAAAILRPGQPPELFADVPRGWVTGPMFQGYWLGPGRTAVAGGRPNTAQQALLEANATAVETVVAAIRPGRL